MNPIDNTLGIYIHVPFCKSKCPYCNFYSVAPGCTEEYISSVCSEVRKWGKKTNKIVDTIYLGGGTPSLINSEYICKIIDCIKQEFKVLNPEITMELNPADYSCVDFEKLSFYGLNRVSVGAQSLNDNELKNLGRRHNVQDVLKTCAEIKKAKIENISMDLMLGSSLQTLATIDDFFDFCVENNIPHISTYLLKIEKNTKFYSLLPQLNLPDDDQSADIYEYVCKSLKENGYIHYEISNFAKSGFESKHNLKYWDLRDYLGIGPSAHSLLNGIRFYYPNDLKEFIKSPKNISEGVFEAQKEYIMLKMRLADGINFDEYKKIFGSQIPRKVIDVAKIYSNSGLVKCDVNKISLTDKGMLLSNAIISEMI